MVDTTIVIKLKDAKNTELVTKTEVILGIKVTESQ